MKNNILKVEGLNREYRSGGRSLQVLKDISFEAFEGDRMAIVGPSGSGKTTLLGLCAGLDQPTSGIVALNGIKLNTLDEDERAQIRNHYVGFIFQNFQLIPTLSALENVMVPLELQGGRNARKISEEWLRRVGLEDRKGHYPVQLSGGEQQRVALARAFSNNPRILFADEPTGNLDEETSNLIEDLLFRINKEEGTTLVLVTHDMELAEKTDRIIRLKGGSIVADDDKRTLSVTG